MPISKLVATLLVLLISHWIKPTYALPEPGSVAAGDLPFHLHARAENKDGSLPVYKSPVAKIEDRVSDLLARMTIEEKVSQM